MGDKQYSAPPPYGFNPQAPPPSQVVFTTTNPVMAMPVGPNSARMTCPTCHASISTRVEKETTTKTHLFAFLLCLCFCPFAIIPYCCDCCKNTNHYCPNCNTFLGTYDS